MATAEAGAAADLRRGAPDPAPGGGRSAPAGTAARRRPRAGRGTGRAGALFTAPFLAGFALVFVLPLLYALWQSVFTTLKSGNGLTGERTEFVGFANFARGLQDPAFWAAAGRVLVFACVQIPIMLAVALAMALLLDLARGRAATGFRLGLMIPYMIPMMAGTLIWLYLYSPLLGPLTAIGGLFGLELDFFSGSLLWLSIGNLLTWANVGFNMLILYSALRAVPRDLLEAARLDGASEWRIALSVKIPTVRGSLVLTGMLSIIGMLQIFNEPLVFRVSSPETITSDFTPIMMIFNQAFYSGDYSYAAALSVILAVLVGIVSAVFYRLTNRT